MNRFLFPVSLLIVLLLWFHKSNGQYTNLSFTLNPLPSNDTGVYYVALHNESFSVVCTATSSDQNVFVYWRRTDGSKSSLIKSDGANGASASGDGRTSSDNTSIANQGSSSSSGEGSVSGEGSTPNSASASGSGSGEGSVSGEGSTPNSASASGSGSGITPLFSSAAGSESSQFSSGSTSGEGKQHTAAEFLQVSVLDGIIHCSDAGQYECVAGSGVDSQIESISVNVTVTGICCQEEISSGGNRYIWPETTSNTTVILACPNNTNFSVSRECSASRGWQDFDREGCGVLAEHLNFLIERTNENLTNETLSEYVAELSKVVLESQGSDVDQHGDNLQKIADIFSMITNHVTDSNTMIHNDVVRDVVQTVNSLLQWTPEAVEVQSSSSIINSFEEVVSQYSQQIPENGVQKLNFTSLTLIAERVNIEILKQTGRRFSGGPGDILTTSGGDEHSPDQLSMNEDVAIHLPPSLFENIGDVGMFFGVYKVATLFPTGGMTSSGRQQQVFSRILAATVGQNMKIVNLYQPVTIAFRPQSTGEMIIDPDSKKCKSWNFELQQWTSHGCNTTVDQDGIILCHCNHLTNFAVFVDVCMRQEDCQAATTTEPPPVNEQLKELTNTFSNLTVDNYVEAVSKLTATIEQSTSSEDQQTSENLGTVADYFDNLANFVAESNVNIDSTVVNEVATVVSSLLQWSPENVVVKSSSRVVRSFETILSVSAQQLPLNEVKSINVPSLAIRTERRTVESLKHEGRSFTIGDDRALLGSEHEASPGELPSEKDASIILPRSLFARADGRSDIGSFFGLYNNTNLFPVGGGYADGGINATTVTQTHSPILSATVGDDRVNLENLDEPVIVTLRLDFYDSEFIEPGSEKCVAWDFEIQDWNHKGCTTKISKNRQFATCTCNHLTNFCVLVDICLRQEGCETSTVDSALTYISYVGMPISIASLVLTIITLIIFKNIRQKDVSKYHIQLCLALLFLLIVSLAFVIFSAEDVTVAYGGCALVSILVHYFALSSVLWMAAEALLMFQKLVIVFVQITTKYIIIISIVCWTLPIIPVFIPLVVDLAVEEQIITRIGPDVSYEFCFLSHPGAFWGAFLAPLLAIILFNVVIFVCVIVVLIKHVKSSAELKNRSVSKEETIRLVLSTFGVMSLFGLTWLFAILTFSTPGLRDTFQIFFTFFNSFQGLFIFLFVCVMSSDVREEWKGLFKIKVHSSPFKHQHDRKPNSSANTSGTKGESKLPSLPLTSTSSDSSPWVKSKEKEARENELTFNDSTTVDICIPKDDVFDDEEKESDPQDLVSEQNPLEEKAKSEGALESEMAEISEKADKSN